MNYRYEEESIKKSMEDIKAEIKILATSNRYIKEQIDLFEEESDEESYSVNVKNSNNDELKKNAQGYNCGEYDFKGKTNVSLHKHTNTKHGGFNEKTKNQERDPISDAIGDLFQIEILDSQQVYACNVCDEGFDREDEVKKHIEINHKDILIKISQNIENSESEDDEAFLARFDDDGNLIG